MADLINKLWHKWLRVPYTLNVVWFNSPKKPRATVVFIHGIGNNAHAWDEVASILSKDLRVIGVDLLGFGDSPKPEWATYSVTDQARAVGLTLVNLRLTGRIILVGHSLGALVSVAIVKRYPLLVKRLILCSPPFYKPNSQKQATYEKILKELYEVASRHPDELVDLSPLAAKAGLANRSLDINRDNVASYIASLRSSIINQKSMVDAESMKVPTRIIYGVWDPVVVGKNIVYLSKVNKHITTKKIMASHEIVGKYVSVVASEVEK